MKIITLLNYYIAKLIVRPGGRKLISFCKGQTFIEVLVALGVIIVIATAISGIVVNSMSNSRSSKDKNLATQYAQEGMEIVRRLRDNDFVAFRSYNTQYCLNGNSSVLDPGSSCPPANVDGFFLRKVRISQGGCDTNVAKITVTTSWLDGKCPANIYCHSVKMESCLSTVNPVPTL